MSRNDILEIRTYGTFDILFEGRSIFNDKCPARSIGLIRYMLYNRGSRFTRDELIERIWPGEAKAPLRNAFSNHIRNAQRVIAFDNSFKRDFSGYIDLRAEDEEYSVETGGDVYVDLDALVSRLGTARSSDNASCLMNAFDAVIAAVGDEAPAPEPARPWIGAYYDHYLDVCAEIADCVVGKLTAQGRRGELDHIRKTCLDAGAANAPFLNALVKNGVMRQMLDAAEEAPENGRADRNDNDSEEYLFDGPRGDVVRKLIGEVIKDYMAGYASKYYIALIDIERNPDMTPYERQALDDVGDEQLMEMINATLLSVLRRRDMFVTFRGDLAVAILYGVRPEYIENLKARINAAFQKNIAHRLKLSVNIQPVMEVQ